MANCFVEDREGDDMEIGVDPRCNIDYIQLLWYADNSRQGSPTAIAPECCYAEAIISLGVALSADGSSTAAIDHRLSQADRRWHGQKAAFTNTHQTTQSQGIRLLLNHCGGSLMGQRTMGGQSATSATHQRMGASEAHANLRFTKGQT